MFRMTASFSRYVSMLVILSFVTAQLPASAGTDTNTMTIDELRARYPNSQFRQVTIDEFQAVTNNPLLNTRLVVAPTNPPAESLSTNSASALGTPSSEHSPPNTTRPGRDRVSVIAVLSCINLSGSLDVGDSDVAVVLFVIVGAVVIAAVIVYTAAFLVSALTQSDDGYSAWWAAGTRGSFFFGGDRQGGMYGLRLAGGFMNESADVGLAAEGGYLSGKAKIGADGDVVDVSGGYGLLGPTVRWVLSDDPNPVMLELELLAGLGSDDNLDWLSRGAVGVSWGISSSWRMGLSLGSLYMAVHATEGPATTDSSFNLAAGLHVERGL